MSFIFLWQPSDQLTPSVREHFAGVLANQCELYQRTLSRPFKWLIHEVHNILIGQIGFDTGVLGWTPWLRCEAGGIAWCGICEDFLGFNWNETAIRWVIEQIGSKPEQTAKWTGRYSLCTWDHQQQRVWITTGTTESPSMWYAKGSNGWAAGNQVLPLLKLVGRNPELNREAASLMLASGYLISNASLLQHVDRLASRQQVELAPQRQPYIRTYISLAEYLYTNDKPLDWQDLAVQKAEHIVRRVQRQAQFSTRPKLLLTGGRDSRCIGAALTHAGYSGAAYTSGHLQSSDVQIAQQVAQTLKIAHVRQSLNEENSVIRLMNESPELAESWSQLSEGINTIRHAVSFPTFFKHQIPHRAEMEQQFHGLGGEITRGPYYVDYPDVDRHRSLQLIHTTMTHRFPLGLKLHKQTSDALADVIQQVDQDINQVDLSLSHWLDVFYWQVRCLRWGEDMLSAHRLNWHWTPLLDRQLILAAWQIEAHPKITHKFIEAMTVANAPALGALPYYEKTHYHSKPLVRSVKRFIKTLVPVSDVISLLTLRKTTKIPVDRHLLQFWNQNIFGRGPHIWHDLIEPKVLRNVLQQQPSSDLLWNVATLEIFARAIGIV